MLVAAIFLVHTASSQVIVLRFCILASKSPLFASDPLGSQVPPPHEPRLDSCFCDSKHPADALPIPPLSLQALFSLLRSPPVHSATLPFCDVLLPYCCGDGDVKT